jgi:tetratricopeptide (TPR) repeat protein
MIFERVLTLDPLNTLAEENLKVARVKSKEQIRSAPDSKQKPGASPVADAKRETSVAEKESRAAHAREKLEPRPRPDSSSGSEKTAPAAQRLPSEKAAGSQLTAAVDRFLTEASGCVAAKDFKGACEALRQAVMIEPNSPEILATFGSLLYQLGEVEQSCQRLARAVELAPNSADYQTRLALTHLTLGRIPEFEASLGRALELDPAHRPALKLLADLSFGQGKFPDAARTYNLILRQEPDNIEVILAMGVCFYKVGDHASARIMFERVLYLQPGNKVAEENLRAASQESTAEGNRSASSVQPAVLPGSVTAAPLPKLRITYLISSILGVTGGNQSLLRQAN